jgi:hypothetical protein
VGHLRRVGKVYLHAVVDTYSSFAFGFRYVSKQPEAVVGYRTTRRCRSTQRSLKPKRDRTPQLEVRRPQTDGFVERFDRTVLDEVFRKAFRRKKLYEESPGARKTKTPAKSARRWDILRIGGSICEEPRITCQTQWYFVDGVFGSSLLLRSSMLYQLGGFDNRVFHYFKDGASVNKLANQDGKPAAPVEHVCGIRSARR